jgi:hypothetical protein
MTEITYTALDRRWTLTDEHSASSYGSPVLVDDRGTPHKADEVIDPDYPIAIFGEVVQRGRVTAIDIVTGHHEHVPPAALATQDGDISGPLTDGALAAQNEMRELVRRFVATRAR